MKTYIVPLILVLGLGLADAFLNFKGLRDKEGINAFSRCLFMRGGRSRKFVERDLKSDQYNNLNQPWNLRKSVGVYPLGFYLPTSSKDVAYAVKCGVSSKVRLVPCSGGHSYEALGWGNNNTVVVDFRNMAKIRVEGKGERAVGIIEPGANVGHINAYLWENGGYAVPMGNCLTVGIGGHAIGGGIGYYATLFGLAVDNVLEVEVVDAAGNIVVANSEKNPDLFWALRGSGPGYIGIATRFKVRLFEASKLKITLVRIAIPNEHFAWSYTQLQKFQAWAKENEPSVYMSFMVTSDHYDSPNVPLFPGTLITSLHLQHPTAQPHDIAAFLKAIHEHFPKPATLLMEVNPNYIQLVTMTGFAPVNLPHPETGNVFPVGNFNRYHNITIPRYPTEEESITFLRLMHKKNPITRYFKGKTFFIKKYFTVEEMEKVAKLLPRMPHSNLWLLCTTEQGRIQTIPRNATAYVHRDSKFDLSVQYEGSADPADVAEGMKYFYEFWDAVQFMDGGETYQNYPDVDLKDSLQRHFKENYGRLVQQKTKWDPKNYFVSGLSLPVNPKQEL